MVGASAWCAHRDIQPLPASPQAVAAFIAAEAQAGRRAATITRRLAAIRYAHRLAGHEPPTNAEAVKATMRGIRRSIGTAPAKGSGHGRSDRRHAGHLPHRHPRRPRPCADRLRLRLGHAPIRACGAAGRGPDRDVRGLSGADPAQQDGPDGEGAEIVIPRGLRIRPVEAVQAWLQAAGIGKGLLFRALQRGGTVKPQGLRGIDLARVVKRYALAAGSRPGRVLRA